MNDHALWWGFWQIASWLFCGALCFGAAELVAWWFDDR